MTQTPKPGPLPTGATISRRALLGGLATALLAAIAGLWFLLSRRRAALARPREQRVPLPGTDGVFFHGPVIITREGGKLTALSARCPHLGCLVGQLDGDQLVCACHGSRFALDGRRRAGPARGDLARLPLAREPGDDTLTITTGR